MVTRPSSRVLSALASLEGNKDFELILEWIKQSREDLIVSGMHSKEEVLSRWHQGAYQALDAFIQHSENARTNLRK